MAITRLITFLVWTLLSLSMAVQMAFADGPSFDEFVVNPVDPRIVFAIFSTASPDGAYLLQSANGGETWHRVARPDSSGYVNFDGRMSVARVLVYVREKPTRSLQIIFLTLDDLWTASSRLDWIHRKAPEYLASVWRDGSSEDLYFITHATTGDTAKLYVRRSAEDNWALINEQLPFACSFCTGDSISSSHILVSNFGEMTHYSRDAGKSWLTPDAQWLESYFAGGMRKSRAAHAHYSREQIHAGMRAVRADEIATEEEFERVRSD